MELDQNEYIETLRPIVSSELTGAHADALATKHVGNLFVSLRGAVAFTVITQSWIMVYVVALQRVQQPTNLDVRRLNALTRKLQKCPQKLVFPSMYAPPQSTSTSTQATDASRESRTRRKATACGA